MARKYIAHGRLLSVRETALRLVGTAREADALVEFADRTVEAVLLRDAKRRRESAAKAAATRRRRLPHAA